MVVVVVVIILHRPMGRGEGAQEPDSGDCPAPCAVRLDVQAAEGGGPEAGMVSALRRQGRRSERDAIAGAMCQLLDWGADALNAGESSSAVLAWLLSQVL